MSKKRKTWEDIKSVRDAGAPPDEDICEMLRRSEYAEPILDHMIDWLEWLDVDRLLDTKATIQDVTTLAGYREALDAVRSKVKTLKRKGVVKDAT